MRRLLFSRWARALAIAGVYLLSWQALGLSRLAYAEAVAECCCHARSAVCHCPVCSHGRAVESGKPFLQTCASSSEEAAVIVLDPSLPAAEPLPPQRIAAQPPRTVPPSLIEAPPREVPTPPPLRAAV
jgi:hypothetical protein